MRSETIILLHAHTNGQVRGFGTSGGFRSTSLVSLLLSANSFEGSLPKIDAPSLEYLALAGNSFSGSIPEHYAALVKLKVLALSQNNLDGTVPTALLRNCKDLQVLDLAANALHGEIPAFGRATALSKLHLRNNRFSGTTGAAADGGHVPGNLTLSLNHLSCDLGFAGNYDGDLRNQHELDVLQGNLFGCPVPSADPFAKSYHCGFSEVYQPAVAVAASFLLFTVAAWYYRREERTTARGAAPPQEWLWHVQARSSITKCAVTLAAVACLVLIPTYATAPALYTCLYALRISAAFVTSSLAVALSTVVMAVALLRFLRLQQRAQRRTTWTQQLRETTARSVLFTSFHPLVAEEAKALTRIAISGEAGARSIACFSECPITRRFRPLRQTVLVENDRGLRLTFQTEPSLLCGGTVRVSVLPGSSLAILTCGSAGHARTLRRTLAAEKWHGCTTQLAPPPRDMVWTPRQSTNLVALLWLVLSVVLTVVPNIGIVLLKGSGNSATVKGIVLLLLTLVKSVLSEYANPFFASRVVANMGSQSRQQTHRMQVSVPFLLAALSNIGVPGL
jgi:hypothetical protein